MNSSISVQLPNSAANHEAGFHLEPVSFRLRGLLRRFGPLRFFALIVSMMAIASLWACGGGGGGTIGSIAPFNFYTAVVVADLNGDSKMDIAACYARVAGAPPHPGTVVIFIQDPANPGRFLPPATYAVGDDPVSIAVADLNGDGKPDIVAANTMLSATGAGSNSVSVLLQDSSHPGQFLPAASYTSSNIINSVAIGDLNGDGRPDLAIADSAGISVLLNNSANPGTFVPGNSVQISGGAGSVAIGDVNGDSLPDLVVANSVNVQVVLADPSSPGNFWTPVSYQAGQQPIFVALGDLNGDGKPDLAVADEGSPSGATLFGVHVLLQNSAAPGTFLAPGNYAPSTITNMLAIADLNNDGKLDLATANLSGGPTINGSPSGTVSVVLQTPTSPGKFQLQANYPGTSFVWWVAVGDMNGDGKPDLVTAEGGIVIRFQDPANPGKFLAPIVIAKE